MKRRSCKFDSTEEKGAKNVFADEEASEIELVASVPFSLRAAKLG
jgi:hypothetical protein